LCWRKANDWHDKEGKEERRRRRKGIERIEIDRVGKGIFSSDFEPYCCSVFMVMLTDCWQISL